MFIVPQRDQLIIAMKTATAENIGFDLKWVSYCCHSNGYHFIPPIFRIRKEPITSQQFLSHRLGRFSDDDSILSLSEFPVTKHSRRHSVSSLESVLILPLIVINTIGTSCKNSWLVRELYCRKRSINLCHTNNTSIIWGNNYVSIFLKSCK